MKALPSERVSKKSLFLLQLSKKLTLALRVSATMRRNTKKEEASALNAGRLYQALAKAVEEKRQEGLVAGIEEGEPGGLVITASRTATKNL